MLVTAGEEALDEDAVFDAVSGCDESVLGVEADGITCCCDVFRRFSSRFKLCHQYLREESENK